MIAPTPPRPEDLDAAHAAQWDAVEEATELLHEQRFHDALLELRRVIKADPTNAYAFYFLGIALYESGEIEAARDAYRACVSVAPKHLGARVALSHVLRTLGDTKGAVKEGLAALSQTDRDGDALYAVGVAYLARGEHTAARRYLEAFLETFPEYEIDAEVRGILAELPP